MLAKILLRIRSNTNIYFSTMATNAGNNNEALISRRGNLCPILGASSKSVNLKLESDFKVEDLLLIITADCVEFGF